MCRIRDGGGSGGMFGLGESGFFWVQHSTRKFDLILLPATTQAAFLCCRVLVLIQEEGAYRINEVEISKMIFFEFLFDLKVFGSRWS